MSRVCRISLLFRLQTFEFWFATICEVFVIWVIKILHGNGCEKSTITYGSTHPWYNIDCKIVASSKRLILYLHLLMYKVTRKLRKWLGYIYKRVWVLVHIYVMGFNNFQQSMAFPLSSSQNYSAYKYIYQCKVQFRTNVFKLTYLW